ncbi:MAG: efflux RND transporter periplasmic adaptor subunit [Gammaproteobacteria bacterium]|nr:efflux RND transporter periplasmic adaptor subunit [Rhodocyclaceae bacterium]MBU3908266.1 efflux RND transporter periplasmic adaptor subunit [Gammaproteobacteria bacterium]MBU3989935.1 efflux RND transporter periplasmic adaptor subunit [Gammaproteobacteria bacterium]MBU4003097.1 efflux RND transporter periplasmic adaptor subunit [Gammaproteobacteria bacterium]MBU4019939.1 efflux RND transporter periplasmic adaptor subunit [Gammaproteobacteria bacterium]
MKLRRLTLATLTLTLLGGGYAVYQYFVAPADGTAYKFAAIERGPITASVSATGTLSPVVSVQVSSQISGQIREILVDYNSVVKAGQLLAQLAPETYEHRVRQAEADLEAARATVAVQQAELYRAKVNLMDAERDYTRKQTLVDKNFISPAELDKAQTLLEAARAQRRVVEAQGKNSEALVKQRAAQLGQAQVDLGRTEIRAPADGIVIKRSVEPGQTVAASLQAPEMFVIAKNLADMRVETAIDEADVGRLKAGQEATFTVDAFPGKRFKGTVTQVRKSALVVSNVVSYTVIIDAANPDLILLPGMTANVRITTAQKDSVLKIANAALRFRPPSDEKSAPAARQQGGGGMAKGGGRPGGAGSGKLWAPGKDGKPTLVEVKTGINDGTQTELVDSDLAEGREFIVGTASAEKPKLATPRMF